MAQIGAVFVFCSPCKILYFASSDHPSIATVLLMTKSRAQCLRIQQKPSKIHATL